METIKAIQVLYEQGKNQKVLLATEYLLKTNSPKKIKEEAYAFRAWAFFRKKEFENARQEAQKAGDNERALRCLAAIAAYHDKNPRKVQEFMSKLPPSPARDNSWIIYARLPHDNTPREKILALARSWIKPDPLDSLNTANTMNNIGRWLIEKGDGEEDLILALGFIQTAIGLYGGNFNRHHRASSWYWISVIQEKLFGKIAAVPACEASVNLWKTQATTDPNNQSFQKNLENNEKRLKALKG